MTDNFADTLVKDLPEPGVRRGSLASVLQALLCAAVLGFLDYVFAALILLKMVRGQLSLFVQIL